MPKSINAKINPQILKWARETRGFSIEEAAKKISIKNDTLLKAENGDEEISISQLRKAAEVYKRPFPIFFSNLLPETLTIPDFRKNIFQNFEDLNNDSRLLIRHTLEKKKISEELYAELNLHYNYDFINSFSQNDDYRIAGKKIRSILELDEIQNKKFDNYFDSFKLFRARIEDLGIFVFQFSNIEPSQMKGFVFSEIPFPIIMINSKDEIQARIFTLIHEFVHIVLGKTGVCDPTLIIPNRFNHLEVFCNYVTGEALLPDVEISKFDEGHFKDRTQVSKTITTLARKNHVSKSMVLRRLLITNHITETIFKEINDDYVNSHQNFSKKEEKGGGDFYLSFLSHNSNSYLNLIFSGIDKDLISTTRVLRSLDIKLETLNKIQTKIARENR